MNVRVKHLMESPVVSLQSGDTLDMAREAMLAHDFHAVPIVDTHGQPHGILTSTDLMEEDQPGDALIVTRMTERVYTISKEATLKEAAHLMQEHHLHHVVVIEEGKVAGILSSYDFLKLLNEERFEIRMRDGG